MKRNIFTLASLLMIVMLFTACSPQASEVPATPSPIVQGDPTEGQAVLMSSLQKAGAEVKLGDAIAQDFFSVKGRILKVNGVDVQVFEYKSAEAMEAEAALVAPDGGSIGTNMVSWMATPHFYKSGSVLVLYVGDDAATLDLLKSALGEQFAGG